MSQKKITDKKTVEIKYEKSSDYKVFQIHGGYGGVTGNGQLNLNFYTDSAVLPVKTKLSINKSTGEVISQEHITEEFNAIRTVSIGINMDLQIAKNIRKWLDDKIKDLEGLLIK